MTDKTYVTIMELNTGNGNSVNFTNRDELHKLVMSGFGQLPKREHQHSASEIQWRIDMRDGLPHLYVQSKYKFDPRKAVGYVCTFRSAEISKRIETLEPGSTFSFSLVANPTSVKRNKLPDGTWSKQRKVAVGSAQTPEWFINKARNAGFDIIAESLNVSEPEIDTIESKNGSPKLNVVHFSGSAKVNNLETFKKTLATGFGRGRAYGCGLLVVGRIENI